MPAKAALVITLAVAAGWFTARYKRARTDYQDAKGNVDVKRRILGVERRAFAIVAFIVFIVVWWWLDSHS
jgi:hypothetical protein